MKRTLQEWREKVRKERKFVGRKPFSHNIITFVLMVIAKDFGDAEANQAIKDFNLSALGWKEEK